MEQATFAELEHDAKERRTRRELFLEKMDGLIPWKQLEARVEPFYPKAGRGRRPYPLGVMLRVLRPRPPKGGGTGIPGVQNRRFRREKGHSDDLPMFGASRATRAPDEGCSDLP